MAEVTTSSYFRSEDTSHLETEVESRSMVGLRTSSKKELWSRVGAGPCKAWPALLGRLIVRAIENQTNVQKAR
jgi:hypothetical protein